MNDFLAHSKFYPEALNHEILFKISSFLLYAPRFKNDILLAQASSWLASDPLMFLPQSVVILLSHLCDMDERSTNVNELWSYPKDAVWGYAENARVIDERFKLYGNDFCFSEFSLWYHVNILINVTASLYPPINYCTNSQCD